MQIGVHDWLDGYLIYGIPSYWFWLCILFHYPLSTTMLGFHSVEWRSSLLFVAVFEILGHGWRLCFFFWCFHGGCCFGWRESVSCWGCSSCRLSGSNSIGFLYGGSVVMCFSSLCLSACSVIRWGVLMSIIDIGRCVLVFCKLWILSYRLVCVV